MIAPGMHAASAAPLDEESCQRLRTEKEALTVLGIDKYFEHGADWVKTNLTAADFNLVKRYVNVFEQLKFRCPVDPGQVGLARLNAVYAIAICIAIFLAFAAQMR
jgi:hypothetical protein